jgi:tetratricopeptide (TPR) repeat protein
MRGEKAKAKELLDQAEKSAPSSAVVLAALGEAALERRNLKEAVRLFGLAKDADPTNIAIEKKHADAVFEEKAKGMFFDPSAMSSSETSAGAKSSMLMSVLLPGLGQIVSGEVGKGIFLMAMVAFGWISAVLIGFRGLFAMLGMGPSKDSNAIVLIPLGLAILFHMIAMFDSAAKAKTIGKRKIDHPVPPANLPFE